MHGVDLYGKIRLAYREGMSERGSSVPDPCQRLSRTPVGTAATNWFNRSCRPIHPRHLFHMVAGSIRREEAHIGDRNDLNLDTILWMPSAPPASTSAVMSVSVTRNMSSWKADSAKAPMSSPSCMGTN